MAQTAQAKLNQFELMQKVLGTWQTKVNTDTIEVWKCEKFGKTIEINVYLLVKDKKVPIRIDYSALSSDKSGFKGFQAWYNGMYQTYFGRFTSENKYCVDFLQDLNPEIILFKYEFLFDSPTSVIATDYSKDGIKRGEYKYIKVD
jgi:hypothetical protein